MRVKSFFFPFQVVSVVVFEVFVFTVSIMLSSVQMFQQNIGNCDFLHIFQTYIVSLSFDLPHSILKLLFVYEPQVLYLITQFVTVPPRHCFTTQTVQS